MKRALIFSLAYYPQVGGAEVAVKEITDRIRDMEFHMLTLRFGSEPLEERMGNVMVHRIPGGRSYLAKILFVPKAAWRARALNRAHSFDVFWAIMSYMTFPITLARMLGVRVPYVLTLQDGDPFERVFKRWYIRPFAPLLRAGFRNASAVSALSKYLATWARKIGYAGAIAIVPNGVDVERFAHASPKEVRKRDGEVLLVTSSRLVHKNATDDVIRALALLPSHVRFMVLGIGPEEQKLRSLAQEFDVSDRVQFGGFVSHKGLPAYLHASDIFVRPSRTEGFGASFPEAMAAGLPVIATQEGGIADFLFDEKRNPDREATGWAVDRDSPEQIAGAVREILADPQKRERVIAAAKKLVAEKYEWNLIATQMQRVLESVVRSA